MIAIARVSLAAFSMVLTSVCHAQLDPPPGPVQPTYTLIRGATGAIPVGPETTPGGPFGSFTLDEPGHYVLTGNLTGEAGKHGIIITSPDITLNLNGYSLAGVPGALTGIIASGNIAGVHIHSGTIRDWPGDGINLGVDRSHRYASLWVGFCGGDGIRMSADSTAEHLVLIGNGGDGLRVERGSADISRVLTIGNGGSGLDIAAESKASGVFALANTSAGIRGADHNVIVNSNAVINGNDGFRLTANNTFEHCLARANQGDGFSVTGIAHVTNSRAIENTGHGVAAGWDLVADRVVALGNGGNGIQAETHTRVIDSYAIDNVGTGIVAGFRPTITGTYASWNDADGFDLGSDAQLTNSQASDNVGVGIRAISNLRLNTTHASFNQQQGVVVTSGGVVMIHSGVNNNGQGGVITGQYSRIMDSYLSSVAGPAAELGRRSEVLRSTVVYEFASVSGVTVGEESRVAESSFYGNGNGVAVHAAGSDVTIEANSFHDAVSAISLQSNGSALVVRNEFFDAPFVPVAGNTWGPIVNMGGGGDLGQMAGSEHPQANFVK